MRFDFLPFSAEAFHASCALIRDTGLHFLIATPERDFDTFAIDVLCFSLID